jgi:mono/diheme cytochrome c family protein
MHRRVLIALSSLAVAGVAAGCGSQENDIKQPGKLPTAGIAEEYQVGAKLFVDRCSGCHNMDLVGAEGGAEKVKDRERVDGPNFNVRREDRNSVLYALRNGGFSGAIMPQDIVVGKEAEQVADFLSKYAGSGPQDSAKQQPVGP